MDEDQSEKLQECQTSPVKTMQLNDQKAGMQGLDKEAINKVIYEASKGTPFFIFQEKRQQRIDKKINYMLEELQKITETQKLEAMKKMDALAAELESKRDLSRSIVHIDMDAFYAAVEMLDNPELKTKPMAVGSSSMLSTSNYEARRYGVRAAMPGFIAKKLCPDLVIVPCHFDRYKSISKQAKNVIKDYDLNYASGGLDEVYFDLTDYILKFSQNEKHSKYCFNKLSQPYVSDVSDDDEELTDAPKCQQNNKQQDVHMCQLGCAEINYEERDALAYKIVNEIRNKICKETGLTCSAGIAPNTMIAKVCSDQNKPNGQYQVPSNVEDVKRFISTLPVRKVSGIGPVQSQLLNGIGINTCGDLWEKRNLVALLFTPSLVEFYLEVALGLGRTTITNEYVRKSIGTEVTFKEIHNPLELHQKCEDLCEELVDDLKSRNLVGKLVVLKIKTVNFITHTRNLTLPLHTSDKDIIAKAAKRLLDGEITAQAPQPLKLRLMGLRMANLLNESEATDEKQAKLSDFFGKTSVSTTCEVNGNHNNENSLLDNSSVPSSSTSNVECKSIEIKNPICELNEPDNGKTLLSESKIMNESIVENAGIRDKNEVECKLTCPVCGMEQNSELFEFNSHVDNCLSKKAIREILSSEMIVSSTTDKRKSSSSHSKTKKPKTEHKPLKKISEYFQ